MKLGLFFGLVATLIHAFATSAIASEVDSFNRRFEPLEDSTELLNSKATQMMKEAVESANLADGPSCDERRLISELRKRFRNHVTDEFNVWLFKDPEVPAIRTPIRQTIYRRFNFFQSPIQGGWARINDPTGIILNVAGVRVGNDKFEHMMGSGYRYYQSYYQRGKPIESALAIGWRAETSVMGALMTGVMSYGDMVANFQGMRFWNDMLGKYPDIFEEDISPYITCNNNQWTLQREMDFTRYIDHGVDEGINCSKFRTPKMLADVLKRLHQYQQQDVDKRSYACPIDPEAFEEIKQRYAPWLEWLVNTDGMSSMKETDTRRPNRR
jgi:hypothetical protein